ncbi:HET-domain-containing protein, partial [Setomelanomma holmii]
MSLGIPSRVLDVGSSDEDGLRLVRRESLNASARYCALSHCWGGTSDHRFILTTENEAQLQKSVPYNDLPRTFQDAIRLCRRLDVRYLWIDSLCIAQNDPKDWAHEAVQMHFIYRDAYLTLIAARATSDSMGFLELREPSTDQQPVAMIDMYDIRNGNPVRVAAHIFRFDLLWTRLPYKSGLGFVADREPVTYRAWIMQERYLSRRKLLFCHDQIFWECQQDTISEDGHMFPTVAFQAEQLYTFHTGYDKWYSLISEYSFCQFTYEKDIFPALTGLTNRVAEFRLGHANPCAGIWIDDIARGLAW